MKPTRLAKKEGGGRCRTIYVKDQDPENFKPLTLGIPKQTKTPQGSTPNAEDRQDMGKSKATLAWIYATHFENYEKGYTSKIFKEIMQSNKVPVNRTQIKGLMMYDSDPENWFVNHPTVSKNRTEAIRCQLLYPES
jgi:hypothetical protein